MCGRVIQKSSPDRPSLGVVEGLQVGSDNRFGNVPPRYNGAPGQDLWVIRRNPDAGERSLDLLRWGLIPHFFADRPKPPPNQRARRDRGPEAHVPAGFCEAPLHRVDRRLL